MERSVYWEETPAHNRKQTQTRGLQRGQREERGLFVFSLGLHLGSLVLPRRETRDNRWRLIAALVVPFRGRGLH